MLGKSVYCTVSILDYCVKQGMFVLKGVKASIDKLARRMAHPLGKSNGNFDTIQRKILKQRTTPTIKQAEYGAEILKDLLRKRHHLLPC